jgi:hypothetical protein
MDESARDALVIGLWSRSLNRHGAYVRGNYRIYLELPAHPTDKQGPPGLVV